MTLKDRKLRLPAYLENTPAWSDYAQAVSDVFDKYVDVPLQQHADSLKVSTYHPKQLAIKQGKEFLSFDDYTYAGTRWVSKGNRIRMAAMLGYPVIDATNLGDETIELLVNSGAQFLPNQGKPEFVSFLNYVLNATLDVKKLWCNELRAGAQLSTHTENFASSDYVQTNTTVVSGVAYSPWGTLLYGPTVDRVYETAAVGTHTIDRTYTGLRPNTAYVSSRHLKRSNRNWAYLELSNGVTTVRVWVNMLTGAVGLNTGVDNVKVTPVKFGYYRISGSFNTDSTGWMKVRYGSAISEGYASYLGSATSSQFQIGDQFERGISASEYSYMGASGSNVVASDGYGTFAVEDSPDVGIPVYKSGSWFPTEHVDVHIKVDQDRNVNMENFRAFFKFSAPIHLVLRNVIYGSNFVFNTLTVSAAMRPSSSMKIQYFCRIPGRTCVPGLAIPGQAIPSVFLP